MKQPIKAALYMRLSQDDGSFGDSVSIETQRTILRAYAREHLIPVADEYVDDGWSGTNFERPDFKRMMDDIGSGKINCVIVKDLSRFGREHIMVGYYLELDFPNRGIRFIAINDNEDTEKGLSDFATIKTVFNEWFARDTSRKIKAAFDAKRRAGDNIFTYAPLGYKKDPDNKCHLLVDEETAPIVRKIFDLAYQGYGASKIMRVLYDERIPTPSWFHYQRNGSFASAFQGKPESKRYEWTLSHVKKIMCDEVYIGNTVSCRQRKVSFKSKKIIKTQKNEWFVVENTHEPIISREIFDRVQEHAAKRYRPRSDGTMQIFAGLLKCPDCGWGFNYNVNRQNKVPYAYYRCRSSVEKVGKCSAHYIRYDVLYAYVLSRLQYWTNAVQQNKQGILDKLQMSLTAEQRAENKRAASEIDAAQKRLAKLDNLLAKLYEDRLSEAVTERNFYMLAEKYQTEQDKLAVKIETLSAQLEAVRQQSDGIEKWVELVKQYSSPTELTADMLNALIQKIVIHEAEKDETGERKQEIEIFYRFIGKVEKQYL